MRKSIALVAWFVVSLSLVLAGCAGATPEPPPTSTPQPTATPAPPDPPTHTHTPEPTPSATPVPTAAGAAGYDRAASFAGDWSGEWHNQTFNTTGSADATITVNTDGTFEVNIDLGGQVFGLSDPPPLTFAGEYGADGGSLSLQNDSLFGNVTLNVDADHNLTGTVEDSPSGYAMEIEGTLSPETIELNYTITVSGNQLAEGVLTLTRQ